MAAATRPLLLYRRKRNFAATPEPRGRRSRTANGSAHFVVHLHHARQRHFDLRLQVGNALVSWAVPKGPSLDPGRKRLAVQVEDHPLEYGNFEGVIPPGQYGAGKVWIWDRGTWATEADARRALKNGHLRFKLEGERLHGEWSLIRTARRARQPQWLLIKAHDEAERVGNEADDVPLSRWSRLRRRSRSGAPAGASSDRPPPAQPATRQSRTGRHRALPARIGLQLARLVRQAPRGAQWLHEVKFDGYRVLIWRQGATVRVTSRGDQDWTSKLPATAHATGQLRCRNCILDGELVALDAEGKSSFGKLQQRFGVTDAEARLRVMVFDLLYLEGSDLRGLPLSERKQKLAALMKGSHAPLVLTTYTVGNGAAAARAACEQGLEGIVSKAIEAPYQDGRGGAWVKFKCVQSDEYAILGYTAGEGTREQLGSLLLGTPAGDSLWRYCGRVGTGFDRHTIAELLRRLKKSRNPVRFANAPSRSQLRGSTPIWVRPELVVEVEFRGRTEDGLLRQASLKGLREDRAVESLRAAQRDAATVKSRNPARRASTARAKRGRTPHARASAPRW